MNDRSARSQLVSVRSAQTAFLVAVALLQARAGAATPQSEANAPTLATPNAPNAAAAEAAPTSLLRLGRPASYYSPFAFMVDKRARTLTVWKQLEIGWQRVAEYPADLGKAEGVKTKRNDKRTPEGIYFLQDRLEGAGLDFNLYGKRAFTTNYPNFFDRLEGKTGSGIWLHAVPDKTPLTRGSRGCVVVRNDAILELSQYVELGKTPVVIADHVDYAKLPATSARTEEISGAIERWRQAWETKDIEAYISFYGTGFSSQRMGRDEWKAYKSRLNSTYKQLTVKLSKPYIIAYKDRAVARFMQEYVSDQHQDFGEKTLYLHKENGEFRIIGEDWADESSRLARDEMKSEASAPPTGTTAAARD